MKPWASTATMPAGSETYCTVRDWSRNWPEEYSPVTNNCWRPSRPRRETPLPSRLGSTRSDFSSPGSPRPLGSAAMVTFDTATIVIMTNSAASAEWRATWGIATGMGSSLRSAGGGLIRRWAGLRVFTGRRRFFRTGHPEAGSSRRGNTYLSNISTVVFLSRISICLNRQAGQGWAAGGKFRVVAGVSTLLIVQSTAPVSRGIYRCLVSCCGAGAGKSLGMPVGPSRFRRAGATIVVIAAIGRGTFW